MRSSHHDAFFDDQELRTGSFQLTFDQDGYAQSHHAIGAIHTNAAGDAKPFTVIIVDPIRRANFKATVGSVIQAAFVARCEETFERRRTGAPGELGTPARDVPALAIRATGAWKDTGKGLVFALAHWEGEHADGTAFEGGWIPTNATAAA